MNPKDRKAIYEWLDHVKNNRRRMQDILETLSSPSGLYASRNALAEIGKEVTPDELHEFADLVQEALNILEENK